MTRTALVIEIEGVLFDTHALRVAAFRHALAGVAIEIAADDVGDALRGATLAMAMDTLAATRTLDDVARELLVRQADDAFHASIAGQPPAFDVETCDAVRTLAIEYPIAVVTRASQPDARLLLEMAGLDASVNVIRSLAGYDVTQYADAWRDAIHRSHAERGVAIAPAPVLVTARAAGLRTLTQGATTIDDRTALVSLATRATSYIASLF